MPKPEEGWGSGWSLAAEVGATLFGVPRADVSLYLF